jgi:RNA polymerase sigma factor (TIGR02999 family)
MDALIPDQPSGVLTGEPGFDVSAQWPLLYAELHRMAARLMSQERSGHTLSPTGLVHEAWLKLSAGERPLQLADRSHFMALSARAMRRILVNHALARRAAKRQGDVPHLTVSLAEAAPSPAAGPEELLAIDQALSQLAAEDPRAAQVAEMKVFAGLDVGEIASALCVSEPTVKRDWVYARARLAQLMA